MKTLLVDSDLCPTIPPLPPDLDKPFWSVMIPTFNSGSYLETSLRSVLCQDPGQTHMQIEVVDDCSNVDNPLETVRKVAGNRVDFFRQPANVGAPRNFNTCLQRARGQWVHILHSDDAVRADYYRSFSRFIEEHPGLDMLFCRAVIIDERGRWLSIAGSPPYFSGTYPNQVRAITFDLTVENFIIAPTVAVRRSVYERLGGFNQSLQHTADWEMWLRIGAQFQVGYLDEPLILRREHEAADTARLAATGANLREIVTTLRWAMDQLPGGPHREKLRQRALRIHSEYALSLRYRFMRRGLYRPAWRQACWAFRLRPSCRNALRLVVSWLQVLVPRRQAAHSKAG